METEKLTKIAAAVFVAAVLVMCLVPSVGMALAGPSEPVANEVPAQPPVLRDSRGVNFAWPGDLADFVEGRFFGRPELITAGRKLSAGAFGATDAREVVVGREGWLFYGETLDNYAGVDGLTDRELFAAARNLGLMAESCEAEGVEFLFTLVPNKISLYPEYAQGALRGESTDARKLYGLLDAQNVPYLDLFQVFGNQPETLYFAHDSHWTSRGAALAADAVLERLGRESGFFAGEFREEPHTGDLYEMLYPAARDGEADMAPVDAPVFTGDAARPDSITINTESAGEGVLLCYRDSFGNSLYPYLAASFENARFSRSPAYDVTLAAELGADTVVAELVERNIGYLLDTPPVVPAPERDVALPETVRGEVRVRADNAETEGWALVSGTLPEEPDTDSPVYVSNGRAVYEAVLTREGFSALLPAGEGPWTVAFTVGGELAAYRAV